MIKPLISIIIPIYNVSSYLRECLESVERQTLKNIEVILINDGSTDGSDKIAEEFVNNNKNFILFNRENGGLSAARNTGIDHANGEYIYFLDSDDFIADDAMEKLYTKAKSENLDQLRFVAYTFEDGTNDFRWIRDKNNKGYKYFGDYSGVFKGEDFFSQTIKNNDYFPSCCLIFTKREIILKNNLRFYEGILHEDNLFNFKLTLLCDRISLLHEPLYFRRYRCGSIVMSDNKIEKLKSLSIGAEEADKFIEERKDIKNNIGKWQITCFIYLILDCWEGMSKDEQNSIETKLYLDKAKLLLRKYRINRFYANLFFFSKFLYRTIKM